VVVAGGVESMTMVPMTGNKLSASPEAMAPRPAVYTPMGITAENVAQRFSISRADQDAFALRSQQKAAAARGAGVFDDEIVPVTASSLRGRQARGRSSSTATSWCEATPRSRASPALKPAFSKEGSVTAGNSSPLSDGAAAALVHEQGEGRRPRREGRSATSARSRPSASTPPSWASAPSRR
jgi:acetyl-CoA acyltransferase